MCNKVLKNWNERFKNLEKKLYRSKKNRMNFVSVQKKVVMLKSSC